jgi:uncharacterized protein (TIGR02646 family)
VKRIRRPSVSPPTLRKGSKASDEADRREKLFATSQDLTQVNADFAAYWGNADVRGALWAMQGRSCAYCDRELHGTDRGDVEHFRPKNVYWWLAYCFDNYLLSCSACNSAYKINKFPILPPAAPFAYAMKDQLGQERRALIDPTLDTADEWFEIRFDLEEAKRKGFQLSIKSGLSPIDLERCTVTRDFFRLNLDSELLKARLLAVHDALKLAREALKGDEDSIAELKRRAVRYRAHSFAVRQVIVTYTQRPQYLPSLEEELMWLIDELVSMLGFALNALNQRPRDSRESDQRDRCAWALAVLMKDPPALTTDAIRERLAETGVLDIVLPFYEDIKAYDNLKDLGVAQDDPTAALG